MCLTLQIRDNNTLIIFQIIRFNSLENRRQNVTNLGQSQGRSAKMATNGNRRIRTFTNLYILI